MHGLHDVQAGHPFVRQALAVQLLRNNTYSYTSGIQARLGYMTHYTYLTAAVHKRDLVLRKQPAHPHGSRNIRFIFSGTRPAEYTNALHNHSFARKISHNISLAILPHGYSPPIILQAQ
jgi:hypothetical protein